MTDCVKKEEKYDKKKYNEFKGKIISSVEHLSCDDTCQKYGGDGHARYEELIITFEDGTQMTIFSGMEADDGIHADTELCVLNKVV
jgi:hypothetical protein